METRRCCADPKSGQSAGNCCICASRRYDVHVDITERANSFTVEQSNCQERKRGACGRAGRTADRILAPGFSLFSARRLKEYRDSFQELKGNRQVCATTIAITQNLLLAKPTDIDHIGEAIRKIQAHGAELAKA
jgi:hypothetical protein